MNLDDYEGHTPAPWIVTRAQKNTILIASKVLGCSDCGSTEIYTHANTGGKEIQFPKSVEPDLFTIDEGKNFLHCVELKGEETNFVGRKIDDKCVKKEIAKNLENSFANINELLQS